MNVVDQIVGKITEVAITKCFHHIGYLCHYNDNVQNLEAETRGLEVVLGSINNRVEKDLRNAQVIKPDVVKWQKDAEEMLDEVATFLANRERSNTKCLNFLCPNLKWRYRLGKESERKTAGVISLKGRGTMFQPVLSMSYPAPTPVSPLTNHDDLDSRQEIFKRILEALKDPTINMIGVHGAGGVGKTRMVKEVHSQAKRDGLFDDAAFAVVSRNLDKKNVQGELAAQLGLNLGDHGREERLLTRLQNGKKNLVILDDVWNPLDLEEIGIPTLTDQGNEEGCCKVLVTSRKNPFQMMTPKASTKVFLIPILKEKEARTLFMKTAEISVNSEEEMSSVEKAVCDECAGLPVAILAVAKALKGKESYAWKDALTQLKNSDIDQIVDIDPNLFSTLKWSYDHLKPRDARSCFLLCSLFPEDAEISIDDLVRYSFGMRLLGPISTLENVRNRVLTLVKGLKESCLLLDGKDDNTFKMHDVIRDVAISIAKDKKGYLVKHDLKKWPEGGTYEGYSAISLMSEYFLEIPRELGCKELRTLVLRSKDSSLPDSFFEGMETNLEVLDLSDTAIETLPLSLSKLVKLRMLFLPKGIKNISLLGELKSLEILCVNGIDELAPEIRQLTCLKLLDLGNNEHVKLRVIPPNVLSNLTRMEELCIPDYFAEWQDEANNEERKNASLVELNLLTCLTTLKVHIPQGKSSPNNLCFENLVRFRISIGEHFSNYGKDESSTNILKLSSVPLDGKFEVLFLKSEVLYLHEVRRDGGEDHLGTPEQFLQTPQLSMLRPFCNLSTLEVWNCTFKYLFNLSVARCLKQLQWLEVSFCSNMEVIVGNERQGDDEQITFPRLKMLVFRGLPNLKSFCPSNRPNSITGVSNSDPSQPLFCEKVAVPVLKELEITSLKINNFSDSDSKLKAIVETPKERDGASNESMANLQSFCNSFGPEESLFNQKVVFPCLEELFINACNVKDIWDRTPPADSFQNLRRLKLYQCYSLLYVAPSELLGTLQNLHTLLIKSSLLEEVFKNRGSDSGEGVDTNVVLPRLRYLTILDSPRLKSFCSGSKLPSSVRRYITNCPLSETPF